MDRNTNKLLYITAQLCPYCGSTPYLVDSTKVYKTDYGKLWYCDCGAYVGCHAGTTKPKGRLADAELRGWKKLAHYYFDRLWKAKMKRKKCSKQEAREAAYNWLSVEMQIIREHTHIGMFDVEECKKVVALCKPYFKET